MKSSRSEELTTELELPEGYTIQEGVYEIVEKEGLISIIF